MIASELRDILLPAYAPCSAFDGCCKDVRYEPSVGFFPRGYAGAQGTLGAISLVLVVAEPGDPSSTATPLPALDTDLVATLAVSVARAFEVGKGAFHRNVRFLLDCCWPSMTFQAQMQRTWITEGVLCSAAKTTGPVAKAVESECSIRYLRKQLELLPDAFVIALGRKADRRLKIAGRVADRCVIAAGLPAGNWTKARPSWVDAAAAFRRHLET